MQYNDIVGFSLSPQQRQLFSLDPGLAVSPFLSQVSLIVEGTVDIHRLKKALIRTAARHEILRTRFASHPALKTLLQVILPEVGVSISCRGTSASEQIECFAPEFTLGMISLPSGRVFDCVLEQISPGKSMLLLTVAAACCDAIGLQRFASDLAGSYSLAEGRSSVSSDDVLQYADVAEHLNSLLKSEIGAIGAQFWQPRIAAGPPDVYARMAQTQPFKQFAPQVVRADLSQDVLNAARNSCTSGDGFYSEEAFLLACWQALLQRISRDIEFVIGYAADGRATPEFKDCAGLFERFLPLKLSGTLDMSFCELVQAIGEATSEILDWQDSFQGLGEGKFLPVCFSYYNGNWDLNLDGVRAACAYISVCSDRFELKLSCTRLASSILVELWYDPGAYQQAEVARLLSQFITVVENASISPGETGFQLSSIDEREKQHLLCQGGYGREGGGPSVVLQIEEQATKHPDAVALEYQGIQLSYAELNRRANLLAHYLRKLGVGPDVGVGIYLPRCTGLVISLLGILKAGGVYVPLDPSYPPERLAYMLEDAKAKLLLTHTELKETLQNSNIPTVCLDAEWHKISVHEVENLSDLCTGMNLVYVIYTSGSTGRPKGVAVTLEGFRNYVNWARTAYECHGGARTPLYSSIGFDLSVTSLWPVLVAGGSIVITAETDGIETVAGDASRTGNYTLLKATPAHLRLFRELLPLERIALGARFVIGGEALRWEELQYWRRHASTLKLVNEYGPTETVVGSCVYETHALWEEEGRVPVGSPIANTRVYVVDQEGHLAPLGMPGELYIGGLGVARGYLNQPSLTAEKFVPDGFGQYSGERLFRTGDLVRWRADDQLDYLGRIDRQIKIRGYRIEIGEIEAVLREQQSVKDCVVTVWQEAPEDKKLAGYVVFEEGDVKPNWEQLKAYLQTKLPEHMIPSVFIELNQLPLTVNGKLDDKALPKPQREREKREYIAPRNGMEEDVARVWMEVLNLERVGVETNFFELGGHSLLATRVIARIQSLLHVELPLRTLFDFPTVALLAQHLQSLESDVEDILLEAESLSDDEINALLSSKNEKPKINKAGQHP